MLTPVNANELCGAIRAHPRVHVAGSRTKARLSAAGDDVTLISTRRLSGIVEYDPGEFTFTALAGTPLREIQSALAERGQYLPFDPPLVENGATIGGTVAAGLSGPGRFRFGGLRDFILAVQFADGTGQILRGGAKVVKNAAGFDIPKFLVGSCGRFGVITEVTFKVFPAPQSWLTLCAPCAGAAEAADIIAKSAGTRWELDALDWRQMRNAGCGVPGEGCVLMRIGGPVKANTALAAEITRIFPGAAPLSESDASVFWRRLGEFEWAHPGGVLAKVPSTLAALAPLAEALAAIPDARAHFSCAGNVALVSLASSADAVRLGTQLRALGLKALVLRGEGCAARLGDCGEAPIESRLRAVFDPAGRFAPLD